MYHGDIHLGDTIDVKFVTTSASTGAPTTLSGTPVISAYIGNSTTQLTAGITLSVDFDSVTGLNNVRVVASSGNGYAAATNVQLVITTGTVGGTSAVGYVVASFSIDCRGVNQVLGTAVTAASAGILDVNAKNLGGTAQTGRDVGASVLLSAGTGTGQLDFTSGVVKANLAQILGTALTETAGQLAGGFKKFFNISTPAATMDHLILVDTTTTATTATNVTNAPTSGDFTAAMKTSLNAATPVATVSGDFSATMKTSLGTAVGTAQTGDSYARLGAPAGASVSADVAAVKTDTGNLVTRITSSLFSGITSLAQWLGAGFGKQTANATAITEIRATGAGSGTFDATTDSQEALRDRGDAAWVTATGFAVAGDAMALVNDAIDALAVADSGSAEIAAAVQSAAATTPLAANVKKINDVAVTGTGVLGDEWGP